MEMESLMATLRSDLALLVEAGFIAVKQLDEMSAVRLFEAARALAPESTAPRLGVGYIALNKLQAREAAAVFQEIVEQEPENALAKAFLGVSYLLLKPKREEGESVLQAVMAETSDPAIKNLAETSLEWVERDLKPGKVRIHYDDGSKKKEAPGPILSPRSSRASKSKKDSR